MEKIDTNVAFDSIIVPPTRLSYSTQPASIKYVIAAIIYRGRVPDKAAAIRTIPFVINQYAKNRRITGFWRVESVENIPVCSLDNVENTGISENHKILEAHKIS